MLLRDVIDLEATNNADMPDGPPPEAEEFEEGEEGEGVGLSLSALEEKLKPEALAAFEAIEAGYAKLEKMSAKRMDTYTSGGELAGRSEKTYEKQRLEIVALVQKVHLHNNRIEELVDQIKGLYRRLDRAGGPGAAPRREPQGQARRVPRALGRGHEMDPAWFDRIAKLKGKGWQAFLAQSRDDAEASATRSARSPPSPACRWASTSASTRPSPAASAT